MGIDHKAFHNMAIAQFETNTRREKRMSVSDWFTDFCAALQVKDTKSISYRYMRITRQLNTDFRDTTSDTANSFYAGSYGRNTAINGFSDLDMIFVLPYSEYEKYNNYTTNGQSALLQSVKKSIEKTYATTSIKADGQVILVPFDDGIVFEVVPAFINKDNSYTFPDANGGGSWRKTNPKPEIEAIRTRNDACNGNLVRLCRMMRAWKVTWGVPISGLLIDTLAYQFIENYQYKDKSFMYFDWLCRDFFEWMAAQSSDQEYWKAPGSGQYVHGKGLFQYKAKRCQNIAVEAIENETKSQDWAAKNKWREIFGTTFPN